MRRALSSLALSLLLLAPARAADLTLDDLLAKHLDAHGGEAAWRAASTLRATGTYVAFSEGGAFTLLRERPDRYRLERTILRKPVTVAHDGGVAWRIDPLVGGDWPFPTPGFDAALQRREALFESPLFGWRDKGNKVVLHGIEDLDGSPAYKVSVELPDGWKETWYLDPATFLERALRSKASDFGTEVESWTYFSDFRRAGGLVLPFRVETEYGTRDVVYEYAEVRTDVAADPAQFRMPPPEGMAPLLPIAGDWDLKIETRPDPRAPWTEIRTTSRIEALLGGALLEERFAYEDQGSRTTVVRQRSYDRFRKRYRFTHTDDFTGHLNLFDGTLQDGKLVASNEATGTTWTAFEQTFSERQTTHDIGPDGFQVDWETSTDGGKTWVLTTQYTYARRR